MSRARDAHDSTPDRQITGTVLAVEREFIRIEVDGREAHIYASELMLDVGETPSQRYAVGDHFDASVFEMGPDPASGLPQFSIRRVAPYADALMRLEVGAVVDATVVNTYDAGIELDINGVRGNAFNTELTLAAGESPHDRYQPGDALERLLVLSANHDARDLRLSVRRNTPAYVEAFAAYEIGNVVDGIVADIQGDDGLWVDIGGVTSGIARRDLALADGESIQKRYAIGDVIERLYVFGINDDARVFYLSARRNTPDYVNALAAYGVGKVVDGIVTGFQDDDGLWVNAGGVIGSVPGDELPLADGGSVQERYAVGETIEGLLVWHVNRDSRALHLSAKRNAPGYPEALQRRTVADVVAGTVTHIDDDNWLWLDIDGLVGSIAPNELTLADGESAQDRYAAGETIEGLFVWHVNRDSRALHLSAKRNAPGYVEALRQHTVGDVVDGDVTRFQSYGGLWLNIDGLVGRVEPWDLALADAESARERYAAGETIRGLFVWEVDHEARDISLSVKRNAPGYVESLQRHAVGDVVPGAIADLDDDWLWFDIDGLVGVVGRQDLDLADGESAQDRYSVGETVNGLFVWQVGHDNRDLSLSIKRNAPGYLEALQRRTVGEVISGTVAALASDGGLWLDVDGLVGAVGPEDLDLADEESAGERYAVGETVDGLFVWFVNHDTRHLALSAKRNTSSYVEALGQRIVGEVVSVPITHVELAGLVVGVQGVIGVIPVSELLLDAGQPPQQRYSVADTIAARVWMIDRVSRMVILSARRSAADFHQEPVAQGATIDAVVQGTTPRDIRMPIRVLTTYSDSSVEIPPHALSLSTGMPPRFEDRQAIRVVVTELDAEGRPTRLSHRQVLDGWEAEMRRLSHSTLVPNARPVPPEALSDAELRAGAAAVDLGPITGFVPEEELDRETGRSIATYNETYRVVVESVDYERRIATVSHERFEQRWRELAAAFEVGAEVDGELRDFDNETALLDLGSGLLAQMPARELPDSDPPGKAARDRIGELFPLRITAIDRDSQTIYVEPREQWVESLIGEPESETLEFKEVLRGDPDADDAKEMTRQAMRTINAFLNTEGGRLIIGVHDTTREVVGLEGDPGLDAGTIEKKIDQATQILETNLANLEPRDLLRDDLDGLVDWDTLSVRGGTLMMITCERGPEAGVNLVIKGKPEFWVREGSSKKQLRTQSEIRDHLRTRQQRAAAGDAASDD